MNEHAGMRSVVIDCHDPASLARFWAAALGWTVRPYSEEDLADLAAEGRSPETDPSVCVDPPNEALPTLWLNKVPEPKVGKVRIHIDVNLDTEADLDRLKDLGATVLQDRPGGNDWTIMADPEGHEFCAFVIGP